MYLYRFYIKSVDTYIEHDFSFLHLVLPEQMKKQCTFELLRMSCCLVGLSKLFVAS